MMLLKIRVMLTFFFIHLTVYGGYHTEVSKRSIIFSETKWKKLQNAMLTIAAPNEKRDAIAQQIKQIIETESCPCVSAADGQPLVVAAVKEHLFQPAYQLMLRMENNELENIVSHDGNTLMTLLAQENVPGLLWMLIWRGLDPRIPRDDGKTAMHLAIEYNAAWAVQVLLDCAKQFKLLDIPNQDGITPRKMVSANYYEDYKNEKNFAIVEIKRRMFRNHL